MLKPLKSAKLPVIMMHIFGCTFFRVLMPRWETAFLPWDLLCSPGRIVWEGDKVPSHGQTLRLLDRIGPVSRFGKNPLAWVTSWDHLRPIMTPSEIVPKVPKTFLRTSKTSTSHLKPFGDNLASFPDNLAPSWDHLIPFYRVYKKTRPPETLKCSKSISWNFNNLFIW